MTILAKISSAALIVDALAAAEYPDALSFWVDVTEADPAVQVGAAYDPETSTFTNPPPVVSPPVPTTFGKVVTQLAFRNRFTAAESVAIELASLHDPAKAVNHADNVRAAGLRMSTKKLDSANYVQTDRADLYTDLLAFELFGLIAVGRATEIIGPPVGSVELPAFVRAAYGLPEIPSDYERSLNGGRGFYSPQEII